MPSRSDRRAPVPLGKANPSAGRPPASTRQRPGDLAVRPSRTAANERFSDWGWGVKLLLVRAAPVGHSLLSAVGSVAAASWGPEGRRPNLCGDLRGGCLSAPGCCRDHLTRRSHGNDLAPPVLWAETDLL